MRIIEQSTVKSALTEAIRGCMTRIDSDFTALLSKRLAEETSPACRWAGQKLLDNAVIAQSDGVPVCQDTGLLTVFCDIGSGAAVNGSIHDAVSAAALEAYSGARKSVCHPLTRQNSGTNLPPVIHYEYVRGDKLTINILLKGAGSENMSALFMLNPTASSEDICNAVCSCVKKGAANACPPLYIGIGIGGTADYACYLSKRALLRKIGEASPDADAARLERAILAAANESGIGMGGFYGKVTALAAAVEIFPTHIGMLPVAVNLQCHALRRGCVVI